MDRLLEQRGAHSSDGPQAEKSSGPSLVEAARQARLRQRKLARLKADDTKDDDKADDA